MTKTANKKRIIWLLVGAGVVVLAIATFFIVKAMTNDGSSYKEYNTEQTVDDISLKLNSVKRLPMVSEECLENVILIGKKEDYTCVIANVTITNNTDKEYVYNYRNFGYRQPGNDKVRPIAITNVSAEGIDITKDMQPGESHTQNVFYSIQKKIELSSLQLTFTISKTSEISLAL